MRKTRTKPPSNQKNLRTAPRKKITTEGQLRGLRSDLWIYLLLFLVTLVAYSQVRTFDFINFDDPEYVADNPHVRAGITPEGAYVRYCKGPNSGNYLLAFFAFCLGLMAKPMIITLPIVLLLLDVWPLRRLSSIPPRRLLVEKLPFFVASPAVAIIAYLVQQGSGAVPLWCRVLPQFCDSI